MVEEIIAVMRAAGERADGARLRALIVVLWQAGLRISEALALAETDMDPRRRTFDVHRAQITFDALDSETGEVTRGRIASTPEAVESWLSRFRGR